MVDPEGEFSDDPSPLDIKEVWVGDHRYIVCRNQDEARKDAADREAIRGVLARALALGSQIVGRQSGLSPILEHIRTDSFQVDEEQYDG